MAKLDSAMPQYKFITEEVTNEYLDRFVPLYEHHISTRNHGVIFNVRGKITQGLSKGKKYESISLFEGDMFLGGLIYSLNSQTISAAYRVFPHVLKIKLPISCSYVAEKYLLERALALGKKTIIHGRDHNVYGLHSAIGLVEYKIRIGCVPYVSKFIENNFHDVKEINPTEDTFVFLGNGIGRQITEGILFSTHSPEITTQKYNVLFSQTTVKVSVRSIGS